MAIWKLGGLAFAAVLGSALLMGPASAMPANGLATVAGKVTNNVQDVRLVCGPYRCWHTWNRWGWNRWGWRRGLYAYAGPGWNRWSMRRPLYAYAGSGWNRWSMRRPLYAYAGPGWNRWGVRRPLYGYGGPGWNAPLYAAAGFATGVGVASAAWDSSWYGAGWNSDPYYGYAGSGWNTGWNGWNGGVGWRQDRW